MARIPRLRPSLEEVAEWLEGMLAPIPHEVFVVLRSEAGRLRALEGELEYIQLHWKCCMRCNLVWHDRRDEIPCPRCTGAAPAKLIDGE